MNYYYLLIACIPPLIGYLIQVHLFEKKRKDERIKKFVNAFFEKSRNDKKAIRHLIPSGISGLKNNKEIKEALNNIGERLRNHPLRDWNKEIEQIGYKKFFTFVVQSGNALTRNTIGSLIEMCKKPN